jgi:hypothetical protein
MVTGSVIAAKVNLGLGKSGGAAGFPYAWYRPNGTGPVIAPGNLMGLTNAYIATNPALAAQPSGWGKADRFGAFDPTEVAAGDYLVGQGESYFVAELVLISGMVRLVICNETFTWSQLGASSTGPGFRRGVLTPTPFAAGWPGWMAIADRRAPSDLHLQGTVEMPNAEILLPASWPGQISRGDQLTTGEAQATTWTVQGAVLSSNGWQVTAIRAGA